ncbi:polysaccharide deacetylase family protein [Tumidithrix helvetica PCC 7403]|uniref:polysaccharide deacetylase family protein n=1 Tax=Tumidithrix helvetica TaxID=3457545 RepID=UPI003C92AC02
MQKTILAGLVLAAVGVGMGAAIAFRLVSNSTSRLSIATTQSTTSTQPTDLTTSITENNQAIGQGKTGADKSFCQFNALNSVTNSLYQVQAINAIAHDPLPTLSNFSGLLKPEFLASFTPAPFPKISDRARSASVPIIMYHDITTSKEVSWDVTPTELEEQIQAIYDNGLTPITLDQLVNHLRTGSSLPEKPILLTFDDNYVGQYTYAFPLLKKYNYPAVWSVHTRFVGSTAGKPKATWDQLREMQRSGLITIASHTVNHYNMLKLDDAKVEEELRVSKQVLEKELGIFIRYFTYPEGSYSERIKQKVAEVGYEAALTMSLDPYQEKPANTSEDILSIMRYGQSRIREAIPLASGGTPSESFTLFPNLTASGNSGINFTTPVQKRQVSIDGFPVTLVYGGRPVTVHADKRGKVEEIMKTADAIAAVDGGFFSLERIDGNKMIGPVMSQFSSNGGVFNPGNKGENPLLNGRPLVLISPTGIKFVPFDASKHTSLDALKAELPDVTDAFVAAGWLVRDGKPQTAESFGKLYGFDASRDRAFWGIDRTGRPVIGVTQEMIDSVGLGKLLAKTGLQDVVMLDSGASASLAYQNRSMMSYEPRPVPHVVALLPPNPVKTEETSTVTCPVSLAPAAVPSQN